MEAGEILSRLSPSPPNFNYIPGGLRGLSPPEIAFVLSGLSVERTALIRAVELDDYSGKEIVINVGIERLKSMPELAGRHKIPKDIFSRLMRLGFIQVTDYKANICHKCKGRHKDQEGKTRIPNINGALKVCNECFGTGRRKIPALWQADTIGMPEATWRQTWRRIYERTSLSLLNDWIESSRYYIKKKYYND